MEDPGLLKRRLEREKKARQQAETLIEQKSRELYTANQALQQLTQHLEERVQEATAEVRAQSKLLEQRVLELAAMNSVAMALTSVRNLNVLLTRIVEKSKEVMGAEAGSLLLIDKAVGQLRFEVARGAATAALRLLTVKVGQGIAGQVALTGQPLRVTDAYQDPRFDPFYDSQSGFKTRSLLAVPIILNGEIIGVLEVINKIGQEAFDEHDVSLFQSFASSAGAALENARLFEQTKRMAEELRDALQKERWLAIEKEKLGAYIPKHVVTEISRNREERLALGGKVVRATVLFSDITGYTRLSEDMEPQQVVAALNVYMTAMADIIEAQAGIVDKFLGDGIMAVFTPASDSDNHALRAVRSGIQMQQKLAELRHDWAHTRAPLADLQMRIGINTGEMVAGNIGSQTRMDYTVIGDDVNVASRIESACRPGAVYVSDATFQRVRGSIEGERMDPLHVKNRVQPVQMYRIQVPAP
jgi:class 3 adenylate cyclase